MPYIFILSNPKSKERISQRYEIMWGWVMNYQRALEKVIQILEGAKITYMLVGGVAVSYYGFPRLTLVIDVMLKLTSEEAQRLVSHTKNAGLKICKEEVLKLVEVGNRFVADFDDCEVNFWLTTCEVDQEMLMHRRRVSIAGRQTWICLPEDLILLELKRGAEWDYNDILGILIRQRKKLKMKALARRTREFFEFEAKDAKLAELVTKAAKYSTWIVRKHLG